MTCRRSLLVWLTLLGASVGSELAGQEGRHNEALGVTVVARQPSDTLSISGVVRDPVAGAPLESAMVSVVGTAIVALTDSSGAFHVRIPDSGEWPLLVQLIGYGREEAPVQVVAGSRTIVRVGMQPRPFYDCGIRISSAPEPLPPRIRVHVLGPDATPSVGEARATVRGWNNELQLTLPLGENGGYTEIDVSGVRYGSPLSLEIEADGYRTWRAENIRLMGDPCRDLASPVVIVRLRPENLGRGSLYQRIAAARVARSPCLRTT